MVEKGATYILLLDLSFLFGCEIVDDVEELPDLLRSLALDHVGNGLASYVTIGHRTRLTPAGKMIERSPK